MLEPLLIEKKKKTWPADVGRGLSQWKGELLFGGNNSSRSSQSTNVVWPSIQLGIWWQSDCGRTSYMTGPLFSFSGERKKAKAIDDARHTHARSHTISTSLYRCGRCRRLSKTFVRPTFWRFLVWGRRKMFKTNDVRQAAALVKSIDGQTSYSIWLDRWPPGGLLCSLPQQREMCVYIHWLTVAPVCVCERHQIKLTYTRLVGG